MDIIEATRLIENGKKVRRKSWSRRDIFYYRRQNMMVIHNESGDKIYYDIDELLADDWEIYKEKSPMGKAFDEWWAKNSVCAEWLKIRKDDVMILFESGWNRAEEHYKSEK